MSSLIGLFLSLIATAHHKPVEPTLTFVEAYRPSDCASDDPLDPCSGEHHRILNPFLRPVEVTISCGSDLDEQTVIVPARTILDVFLELTVSPAKPSPVCVKTRWLVKVPTKGAHEL